MLEEDGSSRVDLEVETTALHSVMTTVQKLFDAADEVHFTLTPPRKISVEYALLAGASCFDTRNAVNRFPVPEGWAVVSRYPSDPSSGFEASTFTNGSEIVISYSGTHPNNAGFFSKDMQTNFALINGNWSPQLLQAAECYLQIKGANGGDGSDSLIGDGFDDCLYGGRGSGGEGDDELYGDGTETDTGSLDSNRLDLRGNDILHDGDEPALTWRRVSEVPLCKEFAQCH